MSPSIDRHGLLLVPPFVSIAFGPLAGPTMLLAAAKSAGHEVDLVDLNERWIRGHRHQLAPEPRRFIGDHDRPSGLSALKEMFYADLGVNLVAETHDEIHASAARIADSDVGRWIDAELECPSVPAVVGVSVMYREQVEIALAITGLVRRRYPEALVIWGGAHVTAMRDQIARDPGYGRSIDGFVFGYAEGTWVDILDAVRARSRLPDEVIAAGDGRTLRAREDLGIVPYFGRLDMFDADRLTLPLQASRGCSYGTCSYCTYPHIEGAPRRVPPAVLQAAIEAAIARGGALSFKDSLVDLDLLVEIAECIRGRAKWSACTKLERGLAKVLPRLARAGCRTLELGLETLEPEAQRLALKRQSAATLCATLDAAARAGIALVINYITGFPDSSPSAEEACKAFVEAELAARPQLVAELEAHTLQVERLAKLGRTPDLFGIRIIRARPWSSVRD